MLQPILAWYYALGSQLCHLEKGNKVGTMYGSTEIHERRSVTVMK